MQTGTIKWFSPSKGYGFIIPDNGGGDAIMHRDEMHIPSSVAELVGRTVTYTVETTPDGMRATDVRLARPVMPCPCCGRAA